ncbi:MAG: V-type ATP synthase subunit D [Saprospiraceae bacterium]
MTDRILMNKNTLAALKTSLTAYREALLIFEMKEQQLANIVLQIEADVMRLQEDITQTEHLVSQWIGVLAEPGVSVEQWVQIAHIHTREKEIVGVRVEEFEAIEFVAVEIDPVATPLWVDAAVEAIREQRERSAIFSVQLKALEKLEEELSEARRMKNALKEVFIPEAIDNIRRIQIFLGDVERLSIGCAKLVKKKKSRSL